MTARLAADVQRDLDRAAAGIGRVPTAAHPDCTCTGPDGTVTPAREADCPQHRPL